MNTNFKAERERINKQVYFFGYKGSKRELLLFYKKLQKEIHFLQLDEDVEDLVEILYSTHPYKMDKKLQLACPINCLAYIAKHTNNFYKHMTLYLLGESGIFISRNGTPISYNTLYHEKEPRYAEDIQRVIKLFYGNKNEKLETLKQKKNK